MGRFFDVLNTPIAALGVLVVVVGVNAFLYLGYRSSETPTAPPAGRRGPQTTTVERTERTGPKEVTRPQRTQPVTTLQKTIPTQRSATASATASATSSPSP
jgi:negative regulator of sigma E activity